MLTLRGVSKSDGAWNLTFLPDAIVLQRIDLGDTTPMRIGRDLFFLTLEYREALRLLVIREPKRVGLRLTPWDQQRLREWLGPRSTQELEHVVSVRLKYHLLSNAAVVAYALLRGADAVFLSIAVVGLANAVIARFRPRAWQLLVEGSCWALLGGRVVWQVYQGEVHSVVVGLLLFGMFALWAKNAFADYLRFA